MFSRMRPIACLGLLAGLATLISGFSASASSVLVSDAYYGGLNTYNNNPTGSPATGDIIGSSGFDIISALVTRTNNDLIVTINTNYVQIIGDSGTGLGALFLGNAANLQYNNNANSSQAVVAPYAYDTFVGNESRFSYAIGVPLTPTLSPSGTATGPSTVYALNGTGSDVMTSNVAGHSQTYPNDPSSPYYFRSGQAVGVNSSALPVTDPNVSATWAVDKTANTLTFDIVNAFDLLTYNTFTLAWAMTCANDVILATVTLPPDAPPPSVPLPAALPLFATGLGVVGLFGWRKKRKAAATAIT